MSCISPVQIHNSGKTILVPCNHCVSCLIRKQSQLEFLAKKELLEVYKKNKGASFVTFTYKDDCIPVNEKGHVTLKKRDLQLFMKGVRRNMEYHHFKIPFKYIACGEYGDAFGRPHKALSRCIFWFVRFASCFFFKKSLEKRLDRCRSAWSRWFALRYKIHAEIYSK